MSDWSKSLSPEDRERGRKFRAVWQTLSGDEQESVGSRYYTTDEEYVNPVTLKTGLAKLAEAGYPDDVLQNTDIIDISMHADCWTDEEMAEYQKKYPHKSK